jgi:hypothetical protein
MKIFFLNLLLVLLCSTCFAQNDNAKSIDTNNAAKIYVIRGTGMTGSAVNFRVIVDSIMYCKIKNNHYGIFYVQPGTHSFYATTWDASNPKEKLALTIPVEAGKSYYMSMRIKQRFFENQIFLEEITYNTAAPLLQKYKQHEKCN